MYVPSWPGLTPADWFRAASPKGLPFPLNAPHRAYAYVARNLIYHLFKALRLRTDEIVLAPDYHHGNEVRAIRAAGATVRFYPITRELEPDLNAVARLCRAGARVLYVIHYLGWPQPMKDLTALCRKHGLILIEDCALALLSEPDGRPLGSYGDYAVFCLYKTLPVPNGGLLVQNGSDGGSVWERLSGLQWKTCSRMSLAARCADLLLAGTRGRADGIGSALSWLKGMAGRSLSTLRVERVPVGDMGFDPAKADLGMSSFGHRLVDRFDYDWIRRRRRENFLALQQGLGGRASLLCNELGKGTCPLFFPILVPNKAAAARALAARGIESVEFWNVGDPEASGPACSQAQLLRDHVLELPVHQGLTPAQVDYMADQVASLNLGFSVSRRLRWVRSAGR